MKLVLIKHRDSVSTGTLQGDIIATGTPAAVVIGVDPPNYLQPGDNMVLEIEGIGSLHNRVSGTTDG